MCTSNSIKYNLCMYLFLSVPLSWYVIALFRLCTQWSTRENIVLFSLHSRLHVSSSSSPAHSNYFLYFIVFFFFYFLRTVSFFSCSFSSVLLLLLLIRSYNRSVFLDKFGYCWCCCWCCFHSRQHTIIQSVNRLSREKCYNFHFVVVVVVFVEIKKNSYLEQKNM